MSKDDKKPNGTKFDKGAMHELFKYLGGSRKDEVPPGYTRSVRLGPEHPDGVVKVFKKTEPVKIFDMKPFYDVNNPFEFNGPLDVHALMKNLKNHDRYKKVLEKYLTSDHKKIREDKYLLLKSESDDLVNEITQLINKIDKLDEQAIKHFEFTLDQTLDQINDKDRAIDFMEEMHWFFTTGIRGTDIDIVQKHWLEHVFKFDKMPQIAKENTKDAVKLLFNKKQPLIDELQNKVEIFQIYQRAIQRYRNGEAIIPSNILSEECLDKIQEIVNNHSAWGQNRTFQEAFKFDECKYEIVNGKKKDIGSWKTLYRRVKKHYPRLFKRTTAQR